MNDTQSKPTLFDVKRPAVAGTGIGAAFYLVVALGLLSNLWGDNGWLVPKARTVSQGKNAVSQGYWIGRVMSSPINLFSFVAFGAAMGILFERRRNLTSQQSAFDLDLLGDDEDTLLLPQDALEYRKRLRHLDDEHSSLILIRLLSSGLQRARANWSAEDVGTAIKIQADIQQDNVEAAAHLHTAFDTTFVALVLSLILMYFLHRVQAEQDMFLAKATDWCLQRLPFRMHISKETPS